ncbi:cytochrome P450 monooxygenase-like protein [Apiospora marii]|uniref:Cytochrome P450 monooxygenase-like protein n=1 Tax=Apiospora marii TaxID=335849 RepID=A0ABR1SRJ8_9PEZI
MVPPMHLLAVAAGAHVSGDLWQTLLELHKNYGATVRIAPDELTTTSPGAWKEVYASRPLLLKDPYSQTPALNGSHSLFTAEGDTHKRIRAVLNHSFSDKALRGQARLLEAYADSFLARIRREAARPDSKGGMVDLTKLYGYAAFDTITDLSLGESLCDGLEGLNEHGWVENYFFHAKFSAVRTALSRFSPLDTILGLVLLSMTRKARQRNWKVITGALNRRLAQATSGYGEKEPNEHNSKRSDLLSPLIDRLGSSSSDLQGASSTITRGETLSNGIAFVIAGTQLNTNVLSTATYLLLRHREKWNRLANEVRTRFAAVEDITVQSTQDLPYLDATIHEALRIRHPTPINLPRVVPRGVSLVVDGQAIPEDCVQNDSSLWVEPREFHPERFLPATHPLYEARFEADNKEAFMPFSTGPRNCVGSKLFFAQVRLLLARVVWAYDLEQPKPGGMTVDIGSDWLQQRAWFAFEPQPLWVKPVAPTATKS